MAIQIKVLGPKIDSSAIESVERFFARRLPEDYRQFLFAFNGGTPEPNEFAVPATNNGSGVNSFYGVLGGNKDGDLVYEQRLLKDRLPSGIIAIADAEGGNRVCLSLRMEDYNAVFFWDHELEVEGDTTAALTKLSTSFDCFLGLLRKFDAKNVQLDPKDVKHVWIDPEFRKNINRQ